MPLFRRKDEEGNPSADEVEEEEVSSQPTPEPEPEPEVESNPEPTEESSDDGVSDLFEVPQPEDNDMVVDHLLESPDEGDLSDLTDVTKEDIMGEGDEDLSNDLLAVEEEEDMSDLTNVTKEDIMGEQMDEGMPGVPPATGEVPAPRVKITPQGSRVVRKPPPLDSLGGVRR